MNKCVKYFLTRAFFGGVSLAASLFSPLPEASYLLSFVTGSLVVIALQAVQRRGIR